MRKQKEAFLKAVWERIKGTDCVALDAVMEIAQKQNIEMEAAAKLIKSDAELQSMIRTQAVQMRMIRATEAV